MRDVGDNFFLEQLGEDRRTLRSTRWAESTTFTGEPHEKLGATPRANDAGEPEFEEPTIKVALDGGIPEPSKETVAVLESLFPLALRVS